MANNYKVGYIDESDEDLRAFQRYASHFFKVIPIKPIPEFEDLISIISDSNIDALVVDYDLKEHDKTIHFNGTDVVDHLHEERELFPVFILTSFSEDAEERGDDVNIVYEKTMMFQKDMKFLHRVKTQIEKFKHQIETKENRLVELLEKESLSEKEENEIVDLNFQIEKSLNKGQAKRLKQFNTSNESRLKILLEKADKILTEIQKDSKKDGK